MRQLILIAFLTEAVLLGTAIYLGVLKGKPLAHFGERKFVTIISVLQLLAIGYLACFGMATSTGIIMLVYLREALAKRGPLSALSESDLRSAVMEGAVHRLRPKLLTEGTTILGLAPMLWATGVGAEVIRPMAAPVLGGILVADEVIDLFLPVLFYWVRRRRWRSAKQDEADDDSKLAIPEFPERTIERCTAV